MQLTSNPFGDSAAQRGQSRSRWRRGAFGVTVLAGGFAGAAVLAPLAGASAHHARASHVTSKKRGSGSTNAYASVEASLSALEKKAPKGQTLSETGSTLFFPLFTAWSNAKPLGISINPAGTGSGTGQSSALSGTVNIGASDAYLPASDPKTLLNIPIVVSAQQIDYNVPGLKASEHLKLNGQILNGIYTGQITNWDDKAIGAINKGITLPNLTIVPLHRAEGSGDTFLFTSYIYDQVGSSSFVAQRMGGPNTSSTNFPQVAGEQAESGNSGMLAACEQIKGCIAYIGVSYLRTALRQGLGDAALLNGYRSGGNYVQLTPTNIDNEVASFRNLASNGTESLIDSRAAKNGYPIVNFEYAIVQQNQPNSQTADAIKALLAWAMDPRGGAQTSYLAPVNFRALQPGAMKVAVNLLNSIS